MRFGSVVLLWLFICVIFSNVNVVSAAAGTDSMIGYWKFDETTQGSSVSDSSGDGKSGTSLGTGGATPTTDRPSISFTNPRAYDFDGNDYIEVSDHDSLDGSTFTIAFWVKFDNINSTHQTLVSKWQVGVKQQYTVQLTSANAIGFWTGDGTSGTSGALSSTLNPSEDTWYHITAVASGTNRTLYINGTDNKYTSTGTSAGASDIQLTFGSKKNNSGTYFEYLDGKMDDIRIYSRALSDAEVDELASGTHTSATWDGSSSTNTETAANWDINVLPDPYTKLTIADVTRQPILTANMQAAELTIASLATIDLASYNLTINDSGTFSNSGTLYLNGDNTITNVTNDTNSGMIEYMGSGTYSSGLAFGDIYYDLQFSGIGSWSLDSDLDVNQDLTLADGTLIGSSYTINLADDWITSEGSFTSNTSTVILDGSSGQLISGDNTFNNLTKITSSAQTLTFENNSTQTITGTLTLTGESLNLLALRSSTSGSQWKIDPQGTRNISYVDVQDSNNINGTAIAYSATNTYGTNLTNWTTSPSSSSNSSSSSTSSTTNSPVCNDSIPVGTPDLFQIDAMGSIAKLHFTTIKGVSEYSITYGLMPEANQYGEQFSYYGPLWIIDRNINYLLPFTTYYFKVRAVNGCNAGRWSQTVSINTGGLLTQSQTSVLKTNNLSNLSCSYTIQPGDSLWRIAYQKWGDGTQYSQILSINPNINAKSILNIGQRLSLCK